MNTFKKRLVFTTLVLAGITCAGIAIGLPFLIPILVPVACVLLAGALGMFQSIFKSTENNQADEPRSENTQATEGNHVEACRHKQVNIPNTSVNILFMYNQYNEGNHTPMPIPTPERTTITLV